MERLTKINGKYIEYSDENYNNSIDNRTMLEKCLRKLAEYEDLEKQGLLLRLPTEAYFIKDNIVRKSLIQELVYSPCRKLLLDIRYDDNSLNSYRGYVGNTVFLMQAEAEQKLKEMNTNNGITE